MDHQIEPTPIKKDKKGKSLGIDITKETPAQKEVSRLLIDIARVGNTEHKPSNTGSTNYNMTIPTLNHFGYTAEEPIVLGRQSGDYEIINDEFISYHRPVLYYARTYYKGGYSGHIWIVDGIAQYWGWQYREFIDPEGSGKYGLDRRWVETKLIHCNWGWDGESNGWFYDFQPPHEGEFLNFFYDKIVFKGIKPL